MKFESEYKECLDKLVWATQELHVEVEPFQLEGVAKLIVQPMTGPWRYFHTPQHIFEVGGSQDAIEVLASLFHDLVYVQVDWSINFGISYYIAPYIKEENNRLQIRATDELPFDSFFDMTASIFGFAPETILNPFAGQNEFLSALVAVKALQHILEPKHLFKIAACIEATIPFRGPTEDGKTVSEGLYERLKLTNQRFKLQLAEKELQTTVKQAVRVANRDTISFTYETPDFLSNTWNLLPETNHNLVDSSSSYRVREYRIAVQKMEGFMHSLKPELIFRQYSGEPDDFTYEMMLEKAGRNLEIAKIYLGTKLFAIALIEALSLRIGIDIPLSTLMGELPYQKSLTQHWENFIPDLPLVHPPQTEIEEEVMKLLEIGRTEELSYDLRNSPLATFMVKAIGFEGILHQLPLAKDFFAGQLDGEAFISACDPAAIEMVINGIVQLLDSRKQAICSSIDNIEVAKS